MFVLKVYANDVECFQIFSGLTQLGFSLYVNIAFRDIWFDLGELVFCKILHQNVGKDVLRESLWVPTDLICKLDTVSVIHDLVLSEREGAGPLLSRQIDLLRYPEFGGLTRLQHRDAAGLPIKDKDPYHA